MIRSVNDEILQIFTDDPIIEEIILLGTGTSTCTPDLFCLTTSEQSCHVCKSALFDRESPNNRLNTSALIRYKNKNNQIRNILIDCGKTFYSSALKWFTKYNIKSTDLDGIILTHGHADAMMGLDDLRGWTNSDSFPIAINVPIFLDHITMNVVKQVFPYLVDRKKATGGGFVTSLTFNVFENNSTFNVGDLAIKSISVEHGISSLSKSIPFISNAFKIGQDILYVSDISRIPHESINEFKNLKLLIVDCLRAYPSYSAHFTLPDIVELLKIIEPNQTLLVGISHSMDHYDFKDQLKSLINLSVMPGFDGQIIKFKDNNYI